MTDSTPTATIVDDPQAPVIFAEGVVGGGPSGGDTISLVFARVQYDYSVSPPREYHQVCARVIIPRQALANASEFVSRFLEQPQPSVKEMKPVMN